MSFQWCGDTSSLNCFKQFLSCAKQSAESEFTTRIFLEKTPFNNSPVDIGVISIRNSLNRLLREMEVTKIEMTKTEVTEDGIRYTGRHYKWKIKQSSNRN